MSFKTAKTETCVHNTIKCNNMVTTVVLSSLALSTQSFSTNGPSFQTIATTRSMSTDVRSINFVDKRHTTRIFSTKTDEETFETPPSPTLSDIELSVTDLPPMDPLENLSRMDASSNMMAVAPPSSEREEGDASGISIWAARGILIAVAVLWGTNFGTVKYLEKLCFHPPCTHPPSEFALARFGVAALVASPLLVGRGKEIVFAGLECGLYIALGYFAQAAALQYIDSGKCAFICSLTVVVVPLLSFLLEGRPVRAANLASAALALVGVGVLEGVVEVPHALEAFAATDLPSTATVAAATDVGFL